MLIPRYSLRAILGMLTVAAAFFLVIGYAVQGSAWAIAFSVGVASVAFTLAIHALYFGLVTLLARVFGSEAIVARTSQGGLQLGPHQRSSSPGGRPAKVSETPAEGDS